MSTEFPPPNPMPSPSGRAPGLSTAAVVLLLGLAFLVGNLVMAFVDGRYFPYLLGGSPVAILFGIAGLVDVRVFDALKSKPGTPAWAYVVAVSCFLGGLAMGIPLVFYMQGGVPG